MQTLQESPNYESFQATAGRIIDELEPIYQTFLDVDEFSTTTLDLLKDLPKNINNINLSQTPTLTRDFLSLLTLYVQLHVFWSFVTERRLLLATYAAAYMAVHGRSEKNYATLSAQVDG